MKDEFKIPIQRLEDGKNEFCFEVGKEFLELMNSKEDFDGVLLVNLIADIITRTISLTFNISGEISFPCDRCLEPVSLKIDDEQKIIIKIVNETPEEDSEDIIWLNESDFEYDLNDLIYQFVILSLPMKRVHPDDENGDSTCDSEVIKKLENLNTEKAIDPRWEALSKLKNKTDY